MEAQQLTDKLNEYNRVRQEIEKKIYEDAVNKIEKAHGFFRVLFYGAMTNMFLPEDGKYKFT